jgi:uncharacterized membrane protein YdjX (TVP38/TMEM64 family)
MHGVWGVPIAMTGTVLGACIAFLLGARLGPRWISHLEKVRGVPRVMEAIRAHGWRLVIMLRLAPVLPSSLQSFIFGASHIPFIPFCLATTLGILPGVALGVTLGMAAGEGLAEGVFQWRALVLGVGSVIGIIALVIFSRRMRLRSQ